MLQYGLRFHDAQKLPFEKRLEAIKAQGFDCVHIALSKAGDLPFDKEALTPGYAFYLKRIFEKTGVDPAVLGCYLNLANPDKNELKRIQDTYRAHIRFASILGCGMVGTETGAPNTEYRYDKEKCHSREALKIFTENLRPVIEYAESIGVILAMEPVYRHIVWNPEVARELLDTISSPNLQIIFDPVNLLHPDNLSFRDRVIDDAMSLLSDEIAMLHLKDYRVNGDELDCMAPGLGEMSYDAVLDFMKKRKPFIQATLENTTPDNAEEALLFLKKKELG